jgi:hypothetical protein
MSEFLCSRGRPVTDEDLAVVDEFRQFLRDRATTTATEKEHDMSNVIRCDGPTCDQTTAPDSGTRMAWLSANRGAAHFDFHSPNCLAEWASDQPNPNGTTEVTGR